MSDTKVEGTCLPCNDVETRNWRAWNDLRPPLPDFFHIWGEVYVPNPGVDPMLVMTVPQGINPAILLLDLYLCQRPGIWPRVFVWRPVTNMRPIEARYTEAHIRCGDDTIAKVPVSDVH